MKQRLISLRKKVLLLSGTLWQLKPTPKAGNSMKNAIIMLAVIALILAAFVQMNTIAFC